MKNKKHGILKFIIAAAAIVNLVLLIFTQYGQSTEATETASGTPGIGTTISLPSRFPAVTELDLPNLGERLIAAGSLSAHDANGTDITDRIEFTAVLDGMDERIAHTSFSVRGDGDKEPVTINVDLAVSLNRPVIVLTSDSIVIDKGYNFEPLYYVEEAVDAQGQSILSNTVVIGEVNTEESGTYQVTFQAKDSNGFVSDPKTLTVRVR